MASIKSEKASSPIKTSGPIHHDVIIAMQEPYMQQIVTGNKAYEFRKYLLRPSIQRIWFYRIAPYSSIEYICEIEPARTRKPSDEPLEENGLGNKEFNTHHKDWDGYDFAYKILSVYQLDKPISLDDLKNHHGIKAAPHGVVYPPETLLQIDWRAGTKLRPHPTAITTDSTLTSIQHTSAGVDTNSSSTD